MSEATTAPRGGDDLPEPEIEARGRWWQIWLIWLVPALAVVIAISLAARSYFSQGPEIRIYFQSAEGLAAGKTEVRFKDVVIGEVKYIVLNEDQTRVKVIVALKRSAKNFATSDARFWVVRPRVSAGGVSGLGTLLSGSYIGADIGKSHQERNDFDGLETPPAITHGMEGKRLVLHARDLGSLDIGSTLYYRRIPVGRVVGYKLDDDGKGVTLQAFVDKPNDRYVTEKARFWNASGVDLSLNAEGFNLKTQSLATVVAGGVAFEPGGDDDAQPAKEGAEFALHPDYADAAKENEGPVDRIRMVFPQSVRGLGVGAMVDFRGIRIGSVTSVELDYDPQTLEFPTVVLAEIHPQRLGAVFNRIQAEGLTRGEFFRRLVERGFRAQAKRGNILTGQLYIALEFFPKAAKVDFDPTGDPMTLPTQGDSLEEVQNQIADIVKKIDAIPFDSLGKNLDQTLKSADTLLKKLDSQLAPEAAAMLKDARATLGSINAMVADDSEFQNNTRQTLDEVQRAARSFRALSDYLERHPESLLKGKPAADDAAAKIPYRAPPLTLSPTLTPPASGASR